MRIMRVHDRVVVSGIEGRVSKILPDGKLEVILSSVINTPKGLTNVAIAKPVTIYRICECR